MKGMSAVIAVVLILLITVSLAAAGYLFFSGIMGSTTQSATQSISQVTTAITRDFTIESVRGEKIYIRNIGQGELSGFSIYIDDTLLNTTNITIPQSEVRNITVYDFIDYSRPRSLKVATSGVIKTTAVGPANQYPDLVGYWKFDEGSGTTAMDSSQNNLVGTLNGNGVQWATGKYNNALYFNGADNTYVAIGNDPRVDFDDDDYSILLWVKNNKYIPDGWEDSYVNKANYSQQNFRQGYSLAIRGSMDQTRLGKGYAYLCLSTSCGSYEITTPQPINDSAWHHLAFTVDRQGFETFYLDGVSLGRIDISPRALYNESNNIPLYIGARSVDTASTTNGTLDEVMIWRRALTPEEVWNYYAHGPV